MSEPELLDEHILEQRGCVYTVRRWYRGVHPELGQITWGYTGWETVVECRVVRPLHFFTVLEPAQP